MTDNDRDTHGDPRALPDREHELLLQLAVLTVASQLNADLDAARQALGELAGRGEVRVTSPDGYDWYLEACGHVIVHSTRPWLASHTNDPNYN